MKPKKESHADGPCPVWARLCLRMARHLRSCFFGGTQLPLPPVCGTVCICRGAHGAHYATGVALLAICVFMMLGMELMNSAVERAVDKPDTTHWWSAGAAKDMAAGGVLVTAFGAVIVGICLFGNEVALNAIWTSVTATPLSTRFGCFRWCWPTCSPSALASRNRSKPQKKIKPKKNKARLLNRAARVNPTGPNSLQIAAD